ncbi:MAG: transporter substrate-binding domain-containing protein [Burkholderiales bacterium]|nr:transporter substrate-binding domain-containing protein [Burkholderiales bacterium]
MRIGVIPARPPYFWQEDGKWVGFSVVMGEDVAKALSKKMGKDIKVEWVITSFTAIILDLQANKVDAFFGLSFSEERKKAIHLVGPLYSLPSVVLKAKGLQIGDRWADFDKPDIKIAVVMGTTDEQVARKMLPNANIRALKGTGEAILDVQSRNAVAWVTTPLTGLGALKANQSLGSMAVLQPTNDAPSYGGTRRDGDDRFGNFLQEWAVAYRADGSAKKVIFNAMEKFGLDTSQLPAAVQF